MCWGSLVSWRLSFVGCSICVLGSPIVRVVGLGDPVFVPVAVGIGHLEQLLVACFSVHIVLLQLVDSWGCWVGPCSEHECQDDTYLKGHFSRNIWENAQTVPAPLSNFSDIPNFTFSMPPLPGNVEMWERAKPCKFPFQNHFSVLFISQPTPRSSFFVFFSAAVKFTIIMVESVSNPDVMHCSVTSLRNPEMTVCPCPIAKVTILTVMSLGNLDVTSLSIHQVHSGPSTPGLNS